MGEEGVARNKTKLEDFHSSKYLSMTLWPQVVHSLRKQSHILKELKHPVNLRFCETVQGYQPVKL